MLQFNCSTPEARINIDPVKLFQYFLVLQPTIEMDFKRLVQLEATKRSRVTLKKILHPYSHGKKKVHSSSMFFIDRSLKSVNPKKHLIQTYCVLVFPKSKSVFRNQVGQTSTIYNLLTTISNNNLK